MAKERTNDLYFEFERKVELDFLDAKIVVSDEQPCGNKVAVEKANDEKTKWKLTLSAGRHKTKAVATWFGEEIKDGECIAETEKDKFPQELNFAFSGRLSVKKYDKIIEIPLVIGQGSHGSTNNWWVGSPSGMITHDSGKETLRILITEKDTRDNVCYEHIFKFAPSDNMTFQVDYKICLKAGQMEVKHCTTPITKYDKYNLYKMKAIYDDALIFEVIKNFTDLKRFYHKNGAAVDLAADYAIKEALKIKSADPINFHSLGCTAFSTKDFKGDAYMGRNYDFPQDTSCVCVYCEPRQLVGEAKTYKSIAFAASSHLGIEYDLTGISDETRMLLPFVCLDGINENGVSIAVLAVDTKEGVGPTYKSGNEKNIFTTLAIRYVLDFAETVDHAVKLLKEFGMFATGNGDYHFYISDENGDSRVVEYNYRKESRDIIVTDTNAATNYYVFDKETYGHGHERCQEAKRLIKKARLVERDIWDALKGTAQYGVNSNSYTQWSIVFDNKNRSSEISIRRDWETTNKFTIADFSI